MVSNKRLTNPVDQVGPINRNKCMVVALRSQFVTSRRQFAYIKNIDYLTLDQLRHLFATL